MQGQIIVNLSLYKNLFLIPKRATLKTCFTENKVHIFEVLVFEVSLTEPFVAILILIGDLMFLLVIEK